MATIGWVLSVASCRACSSVRAVPRGATPRYRPWPARVTASASMGPSTRTGVAPWPRSSGMAPWSWAPLWKRTVSAVLRYFGPHRSSLVRSGWRRRGRWPRHPRSCPGPDVLLRLRCRGRVGPTGSGWGPRRGDPSRRATTARHPPASQHRCPLVGAAGSRSGRGTRAGRPGRRGATPGPGTGRRRQPSRALRPLRRSSRAVGLGLGRAR